MMHVQSKPSWQMLLSQAITDPKELISLLELDPSLIPAAERAAKLFPLRVPRGFVARMKKGNIQDPLLKQVLPLDVEFDQMPGYTHDPLGEQRANPIPGLLHKYHGRVLLTVTSACAVNCRYCFRREFPYEENNPGKQGWEKTLEYIAVDSTIKEVILSGGDPLVANDAYLVGLTQKIALIPHVQTLRVHSRLPIVLPERVTTTLLEWLMGTRLQPVLVVHCNHPNEVDDNVRSALAKLKKVGVILLNQAVLLKEINDNADVLVHLNESLFKAGVLPYYLNVLDKVRGIAHFDVNLTTARAIIDQLRRRLPGYLVPRLVQEIAGATSKLDA